MNKAMRMTTLKQAIRYKTGDLIFTTSPELSKVEYENIWKS